MSEAGNTASAEKARTERRAALDELMRLLYDESENASRDKRPLRALYENIVPACSPDTAQEWEHERHVEWTTWQQKRLFFSHRELYKQNFLADIFSPNPKDENLKFETEKRLSRSNLPFCAEVLLTMIAKEGDVRVPDDFIDEFAMPLLKRLLESRFDEEIPNKFFGLVVQVAHQLHLDQDGLVQYVIQRWNDAPVNNTEQVKAYLVQLVSLIPIKKQRSQRMYLKTIHQTILYPRGLTLLLQHLKGYNIDIEDEDKSAAALARLRDLAMDDDLWPAMLFFSIDNEKAIHLFESYMPASTLNILRTIGLANLSPSPAIARITEVVKANRDVINSNAGKHWLTQFDNSGPAAFKIGINHTAIVLRFPTEQTRSKLDDGEGITVQMLQDHVLAVPKGSSSTETQACSILWSRHCAKYASTTVDIGKVGNETVSPVVEDIIARVEAILLCEESPWGTTAEKTRSLLVLPNTLQLRIMTLPIPYSSSKESASPRETDVFVSELSALVTQLASRHLPYHEDFVRLKDEVLKAPKGADFLQFALKLSGMTSTEELGLDEMVVRDAREMVLNWKSSKIESIRAAGLALVANVKGQGKRSEFMLKE
ncbi:hypothetical protein QQZ08_005350 [Neonectria magnoliae]|uniref:Uncharacterized protein n=1 Tax=Neonectria magnoliae TaxID=2732573 RepID=A0ABR1I3Q6_9HYPO